ncbi:unnamed protein product [Sphagnum balticum]
MYTEAEMEALVKQAKEELEQATAPRMQFGFDVVEVQRVGLQPGDILMVTVKNDDLSQDSVDSLRNQLQAVFPNNKVFVFAMGTSDDVQLKIINDSNPLAIQSNPGYCSDCDCGKKATSEAEDEHMKNLAKQAGDSNG